ncbi:MAG: hypothetical protein AAB496_00575 [Patescibacteria group bacterium]
MNKECRFSYSNLDDSLIISCKEQNENVKERFNFGNFIFNLTGKGKIVGIQIMNASEVLPEYNINSDVLNELEKISLITSTNKGLLLVALVIVPKKLQEVRIPIPIMNFSSITN